MNISKKDEKIIKKFFKKFGGPNGHGLPGIRINLEEPLNEALDKMSININLVSNDIHWDDADLWGHGTWEDLAETPLDHNDHATVDFYVYSDFEGERHELQTNIVCYFDQKGLVKIWEGLGWIYTRPDAG